MSQINIDIGIILGTFYGLFFDEHPSSSNNFMWRFVFLFPIATTMLRILLLSIFFNQETPFYYLHENDREGCR